jgi:hypothetical protein
MSLPLVSHLQRHPAALKLGFVAVPAMSAAHAVIAMAPRRL